MAQCSKSTYDKTSETTFAHWGFDKDFQLISYKHTWVTVAANDSHVVIAFKGTNNKHVTDLVADADLWPHVNGNSWVHRGFKRRAEKLLPSIERYLANHQNKAIYITGHSLGGALALFTTCVLEQKGFSPITIFTFGCPKVGNSAYVNLIKSTHYRFVNCTDFVPKMPLALMGYKHHGHLYYLNHNGEIAQGNCLHRFIDQIRANTYSLRRGKLFNSYSDHKMSSYIKKLSRLDNLEIK